MNLSHAYGVPPSPEDGKKLLLKAFDLGVRHFDTAALYGFGKNEILVGETLKELRNEIFLASKCGMTGVNGVRVIDGRPETLLKTIDEALVRLQTDFIDLYYLHRLDKNVPIEDSIGALSDMVKAGKIGAIGLSEVSAATIKKAQKIHPIAAVQNEYSLWSRNVEIGVLKACEEIGAAMVAFSPIGRGLLAGGVTDNNFVERDIRIPMPRFKSPNFEKNMELFHEFVELAKAAEVTPAQLSLSWVLSQSENIHVIPGTTSISHLEENMKSTPISADILQKAGAIFNQSTVHGPRYPAAVQAEIDTEEFV
jgi:aryl-alcohol dehydrogenase-like predicted oxidoreductase